MKIKLPVSRFPRQFDPEVREMMDRTNIDPDLLKEDLRNIRRINHWLGGHFLVRQEIENFINGHSGPLTILDLCTGSGDIPRIVADGCREHQVPVQITATDLNPIMLEEAARLCGDYPEIQFREANALNPPFPDAQFDWVMCNLALHHFSAEDAVKVLKQMWRLSRRAILVNDLHRGRSASFLAKNLVPLFSSNPMTRFDADLSTRRAFTDHEMLRLAFHAEIPSPVVRHYFFARQAMMAMKS